MNSMDNFILYKFIYGVPKDFAMFCKSKLEFELLDYNIEITKQEKDKKSYKTQKKLEDEVDECDFEGFEFT
ncbi:hypothetical protein D3C76_1334960 [compost metagenome]